MQRRDEWIVLRERHPAGLRSGGFVKMQILDLGSLCFVHEDINESVTGLWRWGVSLQGSNVRKTIQKYAFSKLYHKSN